MYTKIFFKTFLAIFFLSEIANAGETLICSPQNHTRTFYSGKVDKLPYPPAMFTVEMSAENGKDIAKIRGGRFGKSTVTLDVALPTMMYTGKISTGENKGAEFVYIAGSATFISLFRLDGDPFSEVLLAKCDPLD
ncbi:MAG TPA: hypothetical protein DCE52_05725 [Rhodobacteraceae bacterium]|nr:hypothetical protein [Paracoccaceae bacterium]